MEEEAEIVLGVLWPGFGVTSFPTASPIKTSGVRPIMAKWAGMGSEIYRVRDLRGGAYITVLRLDNVQAEVRDSRQRVGYPP